MASPSPTSTKLTWCAITWCSASSAPTTNIRRASRSRCPCWLSREELMHGMPKGQTQARKRFPKGSPRKGRRPQANRLRAQPARIKKVQLQPKLEDKAVHFLGEGRDLALLFAFAVNRKLAAQNRGYIRTSWSFCKRKSKA